MPKEVKNSYFDRELSWLEFNGRVLSEAMNPQVPLLERLKFLAISSSNLDEFFRVRMGALTLLVQGGVSRFSPSGLTPLQQLEGARVRISEMVASQYRCYLQDLVPLLAENGIQRLTQSQLNASQRHMVRQIFEQEIYSVLTPMAIPDNVPFPLLSNQMISLCVRLPQQEVKEDAQANPAKPTGSSFALIPLGTTLSRFITVPSEKGLSYMHLEDVVAMNIQDFFPGNVIEECVPFRITRNAEVEVQELTPQGLAWNMADVLRARTSANCIRLEIDEQCSEQTRAYLMGRLDVTEELLTAVPGPVDLGALLELATRRGFENLRDEPWPAVNSTMVSSEELMFDTLTDHDVLLNHPYESYDPVLRLIDEAADDPDVIAIKQTLYRISRHSQIVKSLIKALENGKHVTVLLELKARFDEERNLKQAAELEARGAQVIYGVKGLKTHAKVCIVVRREPHGIQRYMHFGTGNYNETTAKLYSDISFLTSNEDLGIDALAFFNALAGYSQPPYSYRKLCAAPLRLRDTLQELIENETGRKRNGEDARIILKFNALTDTGLINSLYEASQAGVEILLNIRGICCLKPGVPGLSENIRVVSIVDRFLEHSRILYFHHGGDPKLFISSADWMVRNLDQRKELLVPVESEVSKQRLLDILMTYFRDNVKSKELQSSGTYEVLPEDGSTLVRAQEELYRQARESVRKHERRRRTIFEPHRPDSI